MTRPEQDGGTASAFNPFDPLGQLGQWKALREANLDAWSKMMVDFVNSDAYAGATGRWLDTYLTVSLSFRQAVDQAMTQTLSQYNLPSTADIERLAERLSNMELRLDDLDARLDEMLRLLRTLTDAMVITELAAEKAERAAGEAGQAAGHAAEAAERAAAVADGAQRSAPSAGSEGGSANRRPRKPAGGA